MDNFWPGSLSVITAMNPSGIEFLEFPPAAITPLKNTAMPSESTGAEYLLQIVKLCLLPEILRADLVLGTDTTHAPYQSPVIKL